MKKASITSLIIGYGEIGQGLHKVIGGDFFDMNGKASFSMDLLSYKDIEDKYKIIHICFPYSNDFKRSVEYYKSFFRPKYIVVHSTVPVGTCDSLNVTHSPVRGVHPHIDQGIKTFVKYVGGVNAKRIAKYFKSFGIKTKVTEKASTTEALKLWDTTQYGMMILLNKYMKKWCDENGVDFDIVYTDANKTYNEGYMKLKRPEVVRPYLKYVGGKIGGHCVIPNAHLFKSIPSSILKWFDKYTRMKN